MAVQRPAGSPAPSGPMLMSQGAISAGAIDWPNCGTSAGAGSDAHSAAHAARQLSIRIGRLALFVDAPARNRIVVIDPAQAALGSECCACRLHHAGVIGGAALQHRGAAVPLPRRAEAHWRLGQDWILQSGGCPALSTIRGHLDLPDAPIARPR